MKQYKYHQTQFRYFCLTNALFIDSDKRFKTPDKKGEVDPLVKERFEKVTELEPIILNEGTAKARKFWVFYCAKYQPKK